MNEYQEILLEKLDSAHLYDAGYIVSICPFHLESRPSFFVYEDTYRCASCGRWGQTKELAEKYDSFHTYPKQQEQLYSYNPFSKWLKDHSLYRILEIASMNIPISYLKHRGIDADIQRQLRIGLLDGWITFSILNPEGKIIGAVARAGEGSNSKSKYILPAKQNPDLLYVPSWDRVTAMDKVYLTFGILDAVTLYAAGFASMSTTTGKRITAMAFDNIRKPIFIIPDFSEEKEALKLASKLGWRGKVIQLKYPDGAKDVNDLIWKCNLSLNQLKEMIT
jgi:DNA primase